MFKRLGGMALCAEMRRLPNKSQKHKFSLHFDIDGNNYRWYNGNMIGFSFNYGAKYYRKSDIRLSASNSESKDGVTVTTEEYALDCLKITRTHKLFACGAEYSLLYFENVGERNSKQISKIWDLDEIFAEDKSPKSPAGYWGGAETTQIQMMTGANNRFNEYRRYQEPIGPKGNYYYPDGGRSSRGLMPFFELRNEDLRFGAMLGIGFTGRWKVFFDKKSEGLLMRAGVDGLNFYLKPHEKVRTASVLVYPYTGNQVNAHNEWRRLMLGHFCAETKKGIATPAIFMSWGGQSDGKLKEKIEKYKSYGFKFDGVFLDSAWFGSYPEHKDYLWDDMGGASWFEHVGDFSVNKNIHPDGLKSVSSAAHGIAKTFGLWYEFERAYETAEIVEKRPELFYKTKTNNSYLLNLGSEKGFDYAFSTLTELIDEGIIENFWVDFNIDPLSVFAAEDEENRRGITQLKHIEGLYKLYDKYNEKFPNALIGLCSSGGSRIDIETVSRAFVFWRSDRSCHPDFSLAEAQSHTAGLSWWLPTFATGAPDFAYDKYRLRSIYAAGLDFMELFDKYDDAQMKELRSLYDEYLSVKKYFTKDFYLVFGFSREESGWGGWQYHDSDDDSGIVMAFRREESPSDTVKISLGGLNADKTYLFEFSDTGETLKSSGAQAMSEFEIKIDEKRDSRLIRYRDE